MKDERWREREKDVRWGGKERDWEKKKDEESKELDEKIMHWLTADWCKAKQKWAQWGAARVCPARIKGHRTHSHMQQKDREKQRETKKEAKTEETGFHPKDTRLFSHYHHWIRDIRLECKSYWKGIYFRWDTQHEHRILFTKTAAWSLSLLLLLLLFWLTECV